MTARVVFTAGFSRRYTGGVREFAIEAKNLRGVIREMDSSTLGSATTSKRKPPSRSTARSTRPPISNRSARAARSSSSLSSKGGSGRIVGTLGPQAGNSGGKALLHEVRKSLVTWRDGGVALL